MPKISKVITDPTKPVLVEFQNGKVQPGKETTLESALFYNKRTNKNIVGVANGDMVYSGEIDNTNDLYNNFLVVHNKETKKIQLIQIDCCTVAPLLEKKVSVSELPAYKTSVADLKKEFGSKKAKRYVEQQERLTMNIENVKEHLEKTVEDINVSEIITSVPDENESLYRPKINRQASSKDQVYQLADLVPIEVLDSLEQKVTEILEAEDLSDFGLLQIIEKNILTLKRASLSKRSLIDKCKILVYINYLLHFMNTPLKSMNRKFVACDCSDEVDKHIKQNYMIKGTRPLSLRDKSLCFLIVLLLLAMDFEADLELLSKDLKSLGLKKIQEFARSLGFSQKGSSKTTFTLKIPVPPPVLPFMKRKRSSV